MDDQAGRNPTVFSESTCKDVNRLTGIIWELTSRICFSLRERRLLAKGVRIKIKYDTLTKSKTFDRRLGKASADESDIAPAAIQLFLRRWTCREIRGLGVTAFALISLDSAGVQLALFPPYFEENNELNRTLDRLKQKYGEDIIGRASSLIGRRDILLSRETPGNRDL